MLDTTAAMMSDSRMTTKTATILAHAAFMATLEPHRFRGGEEPGRCVDHPTRWSVQISRGGTWIDTGMCASDVNALERASRNAARAAARADRGTIAGEIGRSVSRTTGTTVVVIDATRPGADDNVPATEGRWWIICNEHGGILNVATRRLAFFHAVTPDEWCPACQDAACAFVLRSGPCGRPRNAHGNAAGVVTSSGSPDHRWTAPK